MYQVICVALYETNALKVEYATIPATVIVKIIIGAYACLTSPRG